MKRYSQHQIKALLDKFMGGQTTVEEEALLADYFRSNDVPAEWEDYRLMFSYFDRGMEGDLVPVEQPRPTLTRLMGRRWWGIAAAACITAAIVATAVFVPTCNHDCARNSPYRFHRDRAYRGDARFCVSTNDTRAACRDATSCFSCREAQKRSQRPTSPASRKCQTRSRERTPATRTGRPEASRLHHRPGGQRIPCRAGRGRQHRCSIDLEQEIENR